MIALVVEGIKVDFAKNPFALLAPVVILKVLASPLTSASVIQAAIFTVHAVTNRGRPRPASTEAFSTLEQTSVSAREAILDPTVPLRFALFRAKTVVFALVPTVVTVRHPTKDTRNVLEPRLVPGAAGETPLALPLRIFATAKPVDRHLRHTASTIPFAPFAIIQELGVNPTAPCREIRYRPATRQFPLLHLKKLLLTRMS